MYYRVCRTKFAVGITWYQNEHTGRWEKPWQLRWTKPNVSNALRRLSVERNTTLTDDGRSLDNTKYITVLAFFVKISITRVYADISPVMRSFSYDPTTICILHQTFIVTYLLMYNVLPRPNMLLLENHIYLLCSGIKNIRLTFTHSKYLQLLFSVLQNTFFYMYTKSTYSNVKF